MSYTEALTQISAIQDQIATLQAAFEPSATNATSTGAAGATGTTSFADALSSAQGASGMSSDVATALPSTASGLAGTTSGLAGTTSGTAGGGVSPYTATTAMPSTGGAAVATGATLPPAASTLLTSDQQQFASRLAADTGLDPGVVSSWLLAEESGGAAVSRQSASNNDWLNIGYTGSGTFGATDSVWSNPLSAADATAGWLKGQNSIPGYGTASAGIQAVLATAGQAPSTQISALQTSGWAGSGYPDLPSLYAQMSGQ